MRNRLHRINNCKFNSNYRFMRSIFNKRNKQATTNDVHHSGPKSPNEMQQNTTSPNNIYADGQSGQNQSNPESIQRKRFVQQQMPGGMYKTQQDGSPRISSTENQTETMNGESSTPQQGQLSLNNALSNSSSASSHSVSDISMGPRHNRPPILNNNRDTSSPRENPQNNKAQQQQSHHAHHNASNTSRNNQNKPNNTSRMNNAQIQFARQSKQQRNMNNNQQNNNTNNSSARAA
eukprot:319082_1